jgi:hypothetical protein
MKRHSDFDQVHLGARRVQLRLHAGVALQHSVVAYPVLAGSFTFQPRYTDT